MTDVATMKPSRTSSPVCMRPPTPKCALQLQEPQDVATAKGRVNLWQDRMPARVVQIVKKERGENNLHYHTTPTASGWC